MLEYKIKCLESALILMELNDHAYTREYSALRKKLRLLKKALRYERKSLALQQKAQRL